MKRLATAVSAFSLLATGALAAVGTIPPPVVPTPSGYVQAQPVFPVDQNGNPSSGGGGGGGGAITPTSVSGGNAAVTVGVTSTIVLTAATRQALALQNTDTVSTLWCRADGGTPAVGTAGYKIPPGSLFSWGPVVMPSGQVNCISDTNPAVAWTEQH
jgi:hypothetical protein